MGGIAWSDHPELPGTFFSVVERDLMGPDRPDDNIVMATEEGDFWGFPFCHWCEGRAPHAASSRLCGVELFVCSVCYAGLPAEVPWVERCASTGQLRQFLAAMWDCSSFRTRCIWYS